MNVGKKQSRAHLWIAFQSARLVGSQTNKSLYDFLLVLVNTSQEFSSNTCVSQDVFDLVRFAVNVVS